jgi:hypothetical protein
MRIARLHGKRRAIVAVGQSHLVISWHLLDELGACMADLSLSFEDARTSASRKMRSHIRPVQSPRRQGQPRGRLLTRPVGWTPIFGLEHLPRPGQYSRSVDNRAAPLTAADSEARLHLQMCTHDAHMGI